MRISFARFVSSPPDGRLCQPQPQPQPQSQPRSATADTDAHKYTTAQLPQVQAPDLEALIAFYVTTQGTQWSNREGWLRDEDIQ